MANLSARSLYQRYLQVISHWPLDSLKEGRDISARIRARIPVLFAKGEQTTLDAEQLRTIQAEVHALERIANNVNRKLYTNSSEDYRTATGLVTEQLRRATSNDFLESMNYLHEIGFVKRFQYRIRLMFQ